MELCCSDLPGQVITAKEDDDDNLERFFGDA